MRFNNRIMAPQLDACGVRVTEVKVPPNPSAVLSFRLLHGLDFRCPVCRLILVEIGDVRPPGSE